MAMTTSTTTATTGHGYCFSDTPVVATTTTTEFQSFDDDGDSNQQQIYGLTTTGMDMIRGTELIPNKNLHHQNTTSEANSSLIWKELFGKTSSSNHQEGPSVVVATGSEELIYQQTDFSAGENNLMVDNRVILDGVVGEEQEQEQEQEQQENSLLRFIFPCQGNERSSQGLSLSLGSSSTTTGLQSFELRQPPPPPHHQEDLIRFFPTNSRDDGFFDKSVNIHHQQQQQQQMIMMMQAGAGINHPHPHPHHHNHQVQFHIRSSKYLGPAQELLNEFCNLGCTNQNDTTSSSSKLLKLQKNNQWQQQQQHQDQENAPTNNTATKILQQSPNLYSLDLLELQKRKTKLLQMLEEVDRRYKHYCNQMRAVVASFESVAGNGTAFVYSALALKAMSKHFRCLKDGIVNQIKATKNALGEKDSTTNGTPGTTRGETPRLRLIDQTLRQQKAFQQMSMMESHPWRPQRGLPERAVSVLRAWLFEHFLHPYPSDVDKHILARQTGLSRSQVSNWFINARVRLWKPMVEEMYLEETKECDNMGLSDGEHHTSMEDTTTTGGRRRQNQNLVRTDHHHHHQEEEEKPTPDKLVRIDSECLSSIINSNNINNPHEKNVVVVDDNHHHHLHGFGRVTDSFGAMELDFSSYNHHQQNIRGGEGGNVSLTLGLQQHGNAGVNLAFSSPTSQNSMFFGREQPIVEDCCPPANVVHHHHHQYSLLESEAQNLPYRNLMGAQLLHDLAG